MAIKSFTFVICESMTEIMDNMGYSRRFAGHIRREIRARERKVIEQTEAAGLSLELIRLRMPEMAEFIEEHGVKTPEVEHETDRFALTFDNISDATLFKLRFFDDIVGEEVH